METSQAQQLLVSQVSQLAQGSKILVNGNLCYFASFLKAGGRCMLFTADTAEHAKGTNHVSTHTYHDFALCKVYPVIEESTTPVIEQPKQTVVMPTTQVSGLIVDPKQFNTVADYVAAVQPLQPELDWASVKDWRSLCLLVGISAEQIGADSAKRVLERAAAKLGKPATPKSVAVKVAKPETVAQDELVTVTSSVTANAPETAKKQDGTAEPLKMPKRYNYADTEEGEAEFDSAMTAYHIAKHEAQKSQPVTVETPKVQQSPKEPKTTPVVVNNISNNEESGEDHEQAAQLLAQAMRLLGNSNKTGKVDAELLAAMISEQVNAATSALRNEFEEIAKNAKGNVTTIEVKVNGAVNQVTGLLHEKFNDILDHAAIRDHVMLVGPAGSGKTTVAEQVAQALGLDFYCQSVCAQTSKSELLGYMDATGGFVSTSFRKAFENGGMFVLDEVDAGNPNVIAVLNSALANTYCSFADGMVKKHEDFVLIACANTFGTGANVQYVGRNQLDAATLDRFSVIEFGYDEKLEMELAPDKTFCQFVQAVRKELAAERVVISPRATFQGGKLIKAGRTADYAVTTRVTKGMPDALKNRVKATFNRFYNK